MMNEEFKREAREFLDDLYENLPPQKTGEEFLNEMERRIRAYHGEEYDALVQALGYWLGGQLERKTRYAIDLIGRLRVSSYLPELKRLRMEILHEESTLPKLWLSFIDAIINELGEYGESQDT